MEEETAQTVPVIPSLPLDTASPRLARTRPGTERRGSIREGQVQTCRVGYTTRKKFAGKYAFLSSNFGKDAPKITIGTSRREPLPSVFSPGPGTYDPPRQPLSHRLEHVFPRSREEKNATTLTSHIDYINQPQFPERRSIKIGQRDRHEFFFLNDTPGPSYMPPNKPSGRVPKIGLRFRSRSVEQGPGPGTYDPNDSFMYSTRVTQLATGAGKRTAWMVGDKNPGPGQYSPVAVGKPREPAYTIGGRSRPNRRRDKKGNVKAVQLGIDVFLVSIKDPNLSEDEIMDYVRSHTELKSVFHEVMEEILEKKPEAPLGYMRDYFRQLRREMYGEEEEQPLPPELAGKFGLW